VSLRAQLRKLVAHSALYGAADVFTNVVNFLLVPLYTAYLSTSDYGVLALLLLFSTLAKVLFRLGLDGAFFRVHYDLKTDAERRSLAGTVALFGGGIGTLLFLGAFALRGPLTRALFGNDAPGSHLVVLAAADVWLGSFAVVPLGLLRIQDRPGVFSAFAAARHTANTLLKVVLVVKGFGVAGVLGSDALATGLFSLLLAPTLVRNASRAFSLQYLREVLRFGLPKVPHGLLLQAQNLADRKILDLFVTRADVGVYQMGYTFGQGVKFALSAFEPAWQPFVYSRIKTQDAPLTIARIVTYAWTGFVALGLGFAVFGRELLFVMTPKNAAFHAAAPIIPVVAFAYVLHGAFLLTSIGIGIEKQARYYPIITGAAAATNIAANFALIPHFGMLGAAWATVFSYALMAALGFVFSQRLYPIPFEWGRSARAVAAAFGAFFLSLLAPPALLPALAVKCVALCAFPALLLASGFLSESERDWLRARVRV
jgi:O-antigen/teichoic acid export membrane protein